MERVMMEDIMEVFKDMKIGKAPCPTEVNAEMIPVSEDVETRVLMEHCQGKLDGK